MRRRGCGRGWPSSWSRIVRACRSRYRGARRCPSLHIEDGAAAELGDLTGSWAWAHTQLLVAEGSGPGGTATMQSDPDRHVSRLLCPRRLRPGARWFACLVPAFDAGVARGLGLPPPDADLEPAWTSEDEVTLPLYFHWSFSTGPAGDFESLARRLTPFVVGAGTGADPTPLAGTVKMHIGAAGGPVDLPDNDPSRIVEMDGALRAVQQSDGTLAEIPTAFTKPLAELLDAIADPSGSDPDDGAVGPPLYGAWAANRFKVGDADRLVPRVEPRPSHPGRRRPRNGGRAARAGRPDDGVLVAGRRRAPGQCAAGASDAVDQGVDPLPSPFDRPPRATRPPSPTRHRSPLERRWADAAGGRCHRARRDHTDVVARRGHRPGAAADARPDQSLRPQGRHRGYTSRCRPAPWQAVSSASSLPVSTPSTRPTSCRPACDRRATRHLRRHPRHPNGSA